MKNRDIELMQVIRERQKQKTDDDRQFSLELSEKYGFSPIQISYLLEVAQKNPQMLSAEVEALSSRGRR